MAPKMIGNERMGDFIFMTWQEFEQHFSIQLNEQQKKCRAECGRASASSGGAGIGENDSAGDEAGLHDLL